MHSNYIVRHNNRLYCFYHSSEGILFRAYERKWSAPSLVLKGARESYSVTVTEDGLTLFAQDVEGNIVLCSYKKTWNNRIVLQNSSSTAGSVLLSPLISGNKLSLIYNAAGDNLVFQQLENNAWTPATRIDRFVPSGYMLYQVQSLSPEHLLLFYQTRGTENNLGYREVGLDRHTDLHNFLSTNLNITDSAFLTTTDSIHVLYILKGLFSYQLIHRKKEGPQFTAPMVLFEGTRIDGCLLGFVNGKLYASYHANGQLYIRLSEDGGNSFGQATVYRKKLCANPIKATYVTNGKLSEGTYFFREVYVDESCPWDIQILPDLYDDFYPAFEKSPQAESLQEIESLKVQLSNYQKELKDKEFQLTQLKSLLSRRVEK